MHNRGFFFQAGERLGFGKKFIIECNRGSHSLPPKDRARNYHHMMRGIAHVANHVLNGGRFSRSDDSPQFAQPTCLR
jgi:hypothetical protein